MNELVAQALTQSNLPVKPCGLNADWSVSAWHLSTGKANMNAGDFYLLDTERTTVDDLPVFEIVQRFYNDNDDDVRVITRGTNLNELLTT